MLRMMKLIVIPNYL